MTQQKNKKAHVFITASDFAKKIRSGNSAHIPIVTYNYLSYHTVGNSFNIARRKCVL